MDLFSITLDSIFVDKKRVDNTFLIHEHSFSLVKIGENGSPFFPGCLKIMNFQDRPQSYENSLEDYSEPGFYLIQDGFIISYLKQDRTIDFITVPNNLRGPFKQAPKLVRKITQDNCSLYGECRSVAILIENGNLAPEICRCSVFNWKLFLTQKFHDHTLKFHSADGTISIVDLASLKDESQPFHFLNSNNAEIVIETFMHFFACSNTNRTNTKNAKPITGPLIKSNRDDKLLRALKQSFKRNLTNVGLRYLDLLESLIKERFHVWFDEKERYSTSIIGPIVNICQSSGSGKSKMAYEITRRRPGIYVALQKANVIGSYPYANNMSQELFDIMSECSSTPEPTAKLLNTFIGYSKIGKCLNWIAKCIVSYFLRLFEKAAEVISKFEKEYPDTSINYESITSEAFRSVQENVDEDFPMIDDSELFEYYKLAVNSGSTNVSLKGLNDITVNNVSSFISRIANDPSLVLKRQKYSASMKSFAKVVSDRIIEFPFTFVVDNINYLNDPGFLSDTGQSKKITGFEVFLRAISYIENDARIVLLTLDKRLDDFFAGLKTQKYTSHRGIYLDRTLPPIIISGNQDIFDEFSTVPFDPTPESLCNPITFKELVSYGHAVWSSHLFKGMIDFAAKKLKNGDEDISKTITSLWMIRTGIKADPTNLFAKELVAAKMATLFDVDRNLNEFSVCYPSEPVLAMAARHLCETVNLAPASAPDKYKNQELIFKGLYDNLNTVIIDRGEYTEKFIGMTLLRAIDKSKNFAKEFANETEYAAGLRQMIEINDELEDLWSKKSYLFETTSENITYFKFPDYHVTTVRCFLSTLYGDNIKDEIEKLPQITLNGIINASHFVKLNRNLGLDLTKLNPSQMPLASDLITDKSRNVIDRSLLRLGLRRQCGFLLPDSYYGFDGIIPVCLNVPGRIGGRPVYTFIGFQVKNTASLTPKELDAMYSCLHFVTCPLKQQPGHDQVTCALCEDPNDMELIYSNQISLSFSLDAAPKTKSRNEFKNLTGNPISPLPVLDALYPANLSAIFGPEFNIEEWRSKNETIEVKSYAFPCCDFAHEYRASNSNLDFNLRVWRYDLAEYLNPVEASTTSTGTKSQQRKKAEVTEKSLNTTAAIFHRNFVLEWSSMEIIKNLFYRGEDAQLNAKKILRKSFHLNTYTNDADVKRYLSALIHDGHTFSTSQNYVTQKWRHHQSITEKDTLEAIKESYQKTAKL